MSEATKNVNRFVVLNTLDCSEHIEKKNNLNYLSWAWAWAELKKKFPDSYYTIYENDKGWNYFTDGNTCWVKTGVTLVDGDFSLEHIEYLPIMDFKNKSIPAGNVNSMDVNKAIQRSLTKACARHGVGLYIYAGEDLPEESEEDKKVRADLLASIESAIRSKTAGMDGASKKAFGDKYIVPIIGNYQFNTCTDIGKLTRLNDAIAKAA